MSVVVKRVDEFTFEDAQLKTPLYIGEKVEDSTFKPAVLYDDENVTTSMKIASNTRREYKVFVRKVESPKKDTEFEGFLDKNLIKTQDGISYVWVILGATKMDDAKKSFKTFITTSNIIHSTYNKAIKNDPIVIEKNKLAAAAMAAEVAAKAAEAPAKAAAKAAAEAAARLEPDEIRKEKMTWSEIRQEEEEEYKKILEKRIGTVTTIEQISSIDEVLNATSLFVCEVYDSKVYDQNQHKGILPFTLQVRTVNGAKDTLTVYYVIIRQSSLFDKKGQIPTDTSDKKKLFEQIVLEPFYQHEDNREYNVFFVLGATDAISAKYAFLKNIVASVGERSKGSYDLHYTTGSMPIPLKKIEALGYVYMSIKKSFPLQIEQGKAVVKYLDEMTPEDVKSAVSIFICQLEEDFSGIIKSSFFTRPDLYEEKKFVLRHPRVNRSIERYDVNLVVRKSVFSDEYGLELYNKIQALLGKPELKKDLPDFFEKVVLEPFKLVGTTKDNEGRLVWFILNAKSPEDALAAMKERFEFTYLGVQSLDRDKVDMFMTEYLIISKVYSTQEAELFIKNPAGIIKKDNPKVTQVDKDDYDWDDDGSGGGDGGGGGGGGEFNPQANPQPKPKSNQLTTTGHGLGFRHVSMGGDRGHTTRKKSRKSIKRAKRSKSVKRHSRSKSRKSRSRK